MLQIPMMFGDGMVLQRQKPIAVWGQAKSGEKVCVTLTGATERYGSHSIETVADEKNFWKVFLPAGEAERDLTLTVSVEGRDEQISYQDICLGEVWIAGGQSNMEYSMQVDADLRQELERPVNSDIRFFDYPKIAYEGQWEELPDPNYGFWRKADAEGLPWFSAVGYYFARVLQKKLDIPVGVIGCNWGGTPACAWLDSKSLEGTDGEVWLTEYEEQTRNLDIPLYEKKTKEMMRRERTMKREPSDPMAVAASKILYPGLTVEEQQKYMELLVESWEDYMPVMGPMNQNRPGGLYETMLKKVAPYTVQGVIWYQGESDAFHADVYAEVFGRMIRCWRELWQQELPFIFAQLAPFGCFLGSDGENYPEIRYQQEMVAKKVPKTWITSIGDAGMQYDIHPKHKRPVGDRMAELALGYVYERPELCKVPGLYDAPELIKTERQKDGIHLMFQHGEGLHLEQHDYTGIGQAKYSDETWKVTEKKICIPAEQIPALKADGIKEITLMDNEMILIGDCMEEVEISFAWEAYYEVNVYNCAGIPVKPFRVKV